MPQVNQTPSAIPARDALRRALEGACYSPDEASDLIEAFRAEVLTLASKSLSELGYPKASALVGDTAEVIAATVNGGAR